MRGLVLLGPRQDRGRRIMAYASGKTAYLRRTMISMLAWERHCLGWNICGPGMVGFAAEIWCLSMGNGNGHVTICDTAVENCWVTQRAMFPFSRS